MQHVGTKITGVHIGLLGQCFEQAMRGHAAKPSSRCQPAGEGTQQLVEDKAEAELRVLGRWRPSAKGASQAYNLTKVDWRFSPVARGILDQRTQLRRFLAKKCSGVAAFAECLCQSPRASNAIRASITRIGHG